MIIIIIVVVVVDDVIVKVVVCHSCCEALQQVQDTRYSNTDGLTQKGRQTAISSCCLFALALRMCFVDGRWFLCQDQWLPHEMCQLLGKCCL